MILKILKVTHRRFIQATYFIDCLFLMIFALLTICFIVHFIIFNRFFSILFIQSMASLH